MIKLAYQEYDYKMSLAAMRQFKEATGKDLWHTLLSLIEANADAIADGKTSLSGIVRLSEVIDFDTGAEVFRAMLTRENNAKVSREDIEDAMFRVGWLPAKTDDGMTEPYTLLLLKMAIDVNAQMNEQPKKKVI